MGAEEYEEDASERASMCCVYNELISGYVSRRCHVQWSTNGVSSWQPVTCSVTSASFSLASFVVARRSVCLSSAERRVLDHRPPTTTVDLISSFAYMYICLAQITRAARNQRAHLIISCFGIPPSLLYFQPNSFTCVTMSMYTQKQSV